MRPERVVEILQDDESDGSGYLISPRYVLTARHVFNPAAVGTVCEVWPLGAAGDNALPLEQRKRPPAQHARVAWTSDRLDLALVRLTTEVLGIQPETVAFGIVVDDGHSYRFVGSGLPEASGNDERRIEGTFNWVRPSLRFDVNVENGPPRDWQKWAGFSGTAIFSAGLLVGVIRTVDENWNGGVLEATPVEHMLRDRSFVRRPHLPKPIAEKVTRSGSPSAGISVDEVSGRYHKLLAERLSKVWIPGEQEPRSLQSAFVDLHLHTDRRPAPRAAWVGIMDATLRRRRNVLPELGGEEEQQAGGGQTKKTINADDLLRRRMRAVILGAPGLGKSTLLKYIALKLLADTTRLPVFLELKRIPSDAFQRGGSLFDLLFDRAFAAVVQPSSTEREALKEFFRSRLEAGKVAVLLDGLDEVRGKELLSDLGNAITEFMQSAYSANDLLISSRPYAFNSQFPGLAEMEIAPMSPAQTKKFLVHYHGNDTALHRLLIPLLSRPELQELASNPGLLGLLVRLYGIHGEIVGDRLELYREIVNSLLTKVDAEKSVVRAFHIPDPDGSLKRDFLEHLALELLLAEGRGDDAERLLFDGDVIREQAARFCCSRKLENIEPRLLADDIRATPLLRQLGTDGYAFAHLTMQEYLAAAALVKSNDCVGFFVRAYFDPAIAELEVLPMAIGLAANPDGLYFILENLPDSLDFINLRLRARSLAYARRVDEAHLRQIGDEVAALILDQITYLRAVWRSLSGTTRRSADVVADRLALLLRKNPKDVRQVSITVLGHLGGDRAVSILLNALKHDDDPGVRERAGAMLPYIAGERAIPELLSRLTTEDSRFRYRVIHGIARIAGERAVRALLGLLKSGDNHNRFYAASALGDMASQEAFPDLLAALRDKTGGQVREGAALALEALGNERAVPALLDALDDNDGDLPGRAAGALAQIGGERTLTGLTKILRARNSSASARMWAAYALGEIGDARAANTLRRALKDPDKTVRASAAEAFGEVAGEQAVPHLLNVLTDAQEDSFVRQRAAESLGVIRDLRAIPALVAVLDDYLNELDDESERGRQRRGRT